MPEPMRGRFGTHVGKTNAEVLREYGPLERGSLYRVGFRQFADGLREGFEVGFIGEFVALSEWGGLPGEVHYTFIIRNPILPEGADENAHLLPLDVWHLSPAEPDDMAALRAVEIEGESAGDRALRKVRTEGWGEHDPA